MNAFLTDSVGDPTGFTVTKCDSYENNLQGLCEKGAKLTLGGNLRNFEGVLYLQTNGKPPYSKG